jgi:hypothetical protein
MDARDRVLWLCVAAGAVILAALQLWWLAAICVAAIPLLWLYMKMIDSMCDE